MSKFITGDRRMRDLIQLATSVAQSKATILIQGEPGTGKKRIASFIHESSSRANHKLLSVNCEITPSSTLESELFGYEKGAFPGAIHTQAGKLESAHGGTLLLEEVSALDLKIQDRLLQVLQDGSVLRVGGRTPSRIDVRILTTTRKNLAQMVRDGKFREDLYYRLNVVNLTVPPLRERLGDIAMIANQFIKDFSIAHGKEISGITSPALVLLEGRPWQGNIRELESVIEGAVLACTEGASITENDFSFTQLQSPADLNSNTSGWIPGRTLDQIEKNVILDALKHHEGNRTHTAKALGISIRTLRNKLADYRRDGLEV